MNSEILRLLSNICSFGTVVETKSAEGLALARVKIDDRVTDFFPVASQSNSYKKHYIPVRVGEQVTVFCPYGEANIGFIVKSIFNKGCKEPMGASDTREVITYEDGTSFFYDTEIKELNINCVGDVKLKVGGNLSIDTTGTIDIKSGSSTKLTASRIDLN